MEFSQIHKSYEHIYSIKKSFCETKELLKACLLQMEVPISSELAENSLTIMKKKVKIHVWISM